MILVDPNFEWHENSMVFREFIFVLLFVCLKPTVRKDTWMRTTCHCYDDVFERDVLEVT